MGLKLVSGEGTALPPTRSVPAPFSRLLRDYKLPNLGMANMWHTF